MAKKDRLNEILQERDEIKKSAQLHWLHWVVVGSSLVLTLGAWYITKEQIKDRTQNQFTRQATQVVELITERLHKYEDALWSGVANIHAQDLNIDYHSWKNFASTLGIEKRYTGINGIGVIYQIKDKDGYASLLEKERKTRPDFKVHPEHEGDEHWPIVYIEPTDINKKAVGLDMAHEENRFTAAKKARDTGQAQITGPIILIQDQKKTPGFLFYAPFYKTKELNTEEERRENFVGMVYAPFIMSKLMKGTLEEEKRLVGVSISDARKTLYTENKEASVTNSHFQNQINVSVYGRIWTFDIWAKESFLSSTANHKPLIILIGGILIDIMLLAFFIFITKSNKRTIDFADRLAESYKDQNSHLKDAESFQEKILENIPDLIFVKDKDFKIVKANKAFMDLYPEDQRDKVIGYTTLEEYDEDEAALFLKNDKEALEKGYNETLEKITFPNGQTETLHTKKIGFEDSAGEKFILAVAHNVTDLKKAEEELINSNLELERFAYVAAHDMQEPVRIIKGFAEILEQNYLEQLDEKGRIYLEGCINGARQIQNLISDLLEYSRLSNVSEDLEAVDMQSVLDSTLINLDTAIKETGANIKCASSLPFVQGNEMRCVRLMQNLLSNAIKYQPEGQKPVIKISFKEKNGQYHFQIEDNGIGIDEKYHEKIFEPFKKLHHHTKYEGTGIGLPICKKIIQTMGGKLWVESVIGKGSKFNFTLQKTPRE